jgi:hypothetical protein
MLREQQTNREESAENKSVGVFGETAEDGGYRYHGNPVTTRQMNERSLFSYPTEARKSTSNHLSNQHFSCRQNTMGTMLELILHPEPAEIAGDLVKWPFCINSFFAQKILCRQYRS